MIRGTTPTHTWELPFDVSLIAEARVLYAQDGKLLLKKTTEDCIMEGKTLKVTLSQEDTLNFDDKKNVEIQLRVLTTDRKSLATTPVKKDIGEVLDDEVIA